MTSHWPTHQPRKHRAYRDPFPLGKRRDPRLWSKTRAVPRAVGSVAASRDSVPAETASGVYASVSPRGSK